MEPSPPSGSEDPTALLPIAEAGVPAPAHAERSWLRSRRAQTFGLGALCGALGLSLVVVVSSIFAAVGDSPQTPIDPAPVSEQQPAPRATPTPPPLEPADETTDASTPPADTAQPLADPEPAPAPVETTAPPPDGTADAPGRSGTAPGHNKEPKRP